MTKMTRIEPRSQQESPLADAWPWITVVAFAAFGFQELAAVCFGIALAGQRNAGQYARKLFEILMRRW